MLRRSLEIPAAAGTKQDVAAEDQARGEEGDMVFEVAGHVDDVECDAQVGVRLCQVETVALFQVVGDMWIFWMSPSVHRHVVYFAQSGDAAYMIVVAMGAEDDFELQAARLEECYHGLGLAWIDHGSMGFVMDGPDVVVVQGWDSGDVNF